MGEVMKNFTLLTIAFLMAACGSRQIVEEVPMHQEINPGIKRMIRAGYFYCINMGENPADCYVMCDEGEPGEGDYCEIGGNTFLADLTCLEDQYGGLLCEEIVEYFEPEETTTEEDEHNYKDECGC